MMNPYAVVDLSWAENLCIGATSCASERLFSTSGNIVTPEAQLVMLMYKYFLPKGYGTARFKLEKNLHVNNTWHYTNLKIFDACLRALGKVMTSPPLVESKHTCYKLVMSLVHELVT